MHQQLRRGMIELVSVHRLDKADIVNVLFDMRQPIGKPQAAFSGAVKRILRAQHFRHAANKSEALADQKRRRTILTVELGQLRFVIEEFQLAGRARHVQINDALGVSRKFRG